MNISHDGTTVSFKTEPQELFLAEKSGAKSNTVRIIDNDEYEMLNKHTPKKIGIRYQEERFIRTLTNLHFARLFGKVIVIFSWAKEENQLDSFEKTLHRLGLQQEAASPAETCQAAKEPSIEERFAAITISNGTLALLQSIAHGRTMNMVIKELYEAFIFNLEKSRRDIHD